MDSTRRRWSPERVVVLAALAFGVAAGTYGIANAANGSGSSPSQSSSPLTGDSLDKVTQLAKAKVPEGTIVRVETDADGHAAYEAHMVKADGTPVTVYVNKQFEVVSVESGMPGPPGRRAPSSSSNASA